ncbi:MAG: hypothetical protein MJ033_05875 [Victivallaceae bacterium]|nr:hypothetical protein [Victivallaceae bacterium]
MKKTAVFLMLLLSASALAENFRFFNIVPYAYGKEEKMAERMINYRTKTGNRDVLYCLTLHPEGVPAMQKADQLIASFRKFKAALGKSDVRAGILVQSILGHWPRVDKEIEPWQRSIDVKGNQVRFCVLDARFQQYIYDVGRKLALEKPSFIMSDDDVRSNCPEIECFCPLHIAELNRRLGTHYTQKEVMAFVADGKPGDKVFDAFMLLSNEIPLTTVKCLRKGIDSVDPAIPTSTCLAGRGQGMLETCRAFAGNHPMMIRITNQMYGEPEPRDYFGQVVLRTMGQRAQYAEIPFVLDEADTWPHTLYSRSAVGLHAKLVSSIFSGLSGAKLWYVDAESNDIPFSPRYSDILGKYQKFYQELARAVGETTPDGVIIPCFLRPYQLHPVKKPSEQRYPAPSWVDSQFGFLGIPFFGVTDYALDRVYALGGKESVDRLTDDELKQLLSRRILIDGIAAKALTQRGFGDLIGCRATGKKFKATLERGADGTKFGNSVSGNTPLIENADPRAEVLTYLYFAPFSTSEKREKVAPGCVYFENALGGKVLTTSFAIDAYSYQRFAVFRKKLLMRLLDKLSDAGKFPFALDDDQPETLLVRRGKDGSFLLYAVNLGFDPLPEVRLRCADTDAKFEELLPDGTWSPLEVKKDNGRIVIDRRLNLYDTLVLRVR